MTLLDERFKTVTFSYDMKDFEKSIRLELDTLMNMGEGYNRYESFVRKLFMSVLTDKEKQIVELTNPPIEKLALLLLNNKRKKLVEEQNHLGDRIAQDKRCYNKVKKQLASLNKVINDLQESQ